MTPRRSSPRRRGAAPVARCLGGLLVLAATLAVPAPTAAGQQRRPGLDGRWAQRRLTLPRFVDANIAGPWATPLLGVRRHVDGAVRGLGVGVDGGVQLVRRADGGPALGGTPGGDPALALFAGVAFGLSDEIEGGALFLSFDLLPGFTYRSPFFVTWARSLGDVDVGVRLVGQLGGPGRIVDTAFVILARAGDFRVDAAATLPVAFDGGGPAEVGWKVPLRVAWNPLPELVLGLETGVVDPDVARARDASFPLGGYLGTTWLVGAVLLDVGASFQWDAFLRPRPPTGLDAVDVSHWRLQAGVTVHQRVF